MKDVNWPKKRKNTLNWLSKNTNLKFQKNINLASKKLLRIISGRSIEVMLSLCSTILEHKMSLLPKTLKVWISQNLKLWKKVLQKPILQNLKRKVWFAKFLENRETVCLKKRKNGILKRQGLQNKQRNENQQNLTKMWKTI